LARKGCCLSDDVYIGWERLSLRVVVDWTRPAFQSGSCVSGPLVLPRFLLAVRTLAAMILQRLLHSLRRVPRRSLVRPKWRFASAAPQCASRVPFLASDRTNPSPLLQTPRVSRVYHPLSPSARPSFHIITPHPLIFRCPSNKFSVLPVGVLRTVFSSPFFIESGCGLRIVDRPSWIDPFPACRFLCSCLTIQNRFAILHSETVRPRVETCGGTELKPLLSGRMGRLSSCGLMISARIRHIEGRRSFEEGQASPTCNPPSTSNPTAPGSEPRLRWQCEIVGGCGLACQTGFAVSFAVTNSTPVARRNRMFHSLYYHSLWATISRRLSLVTFFGLKESNNPETKRPARLCVTISRRSLWSLSLSERKGHQRTDHLRNRTSR
jgi:hypothetical protein